MRHLVPFALASLLSLAMAPMPVRADGARPDRGERLGDAAARLDAVRQGMRARRAMSDVVDAIPDKGPCDDPVAATRCRDGRPMPEGLPEGAWADRAEPPPAGLVLQVTSRDVTATVARETGGSPLSPGDSCRLGLGGTVEVLGTDPDLGALVRFVAPGTASARASQECTSGTVSFVDWRGMRDWASPATASARRDELGARASRAADLIMGTRR